MDKGTPLLVDSDDGYYTFWDTYAGEMNQVMVKTEGRGWVETHLVQVPLSFLEGRYMTDAEHYEEVRRIAGR